MKPVPEIITNNGWQYKEKCRCGGILRYKFRNPAKPGLIVEWWVLYRKFRVLDRNKLKVPATDLKKFEEVW